MGFLGRIYVVARLFLVKLLWTFAPGFVGVV